MLHSCFHEVMESYYYGVKRGNRILSKFIQNYGKLIDKQGSSVSSNYEKYVLFW